MMPKIYWDVLEAVAEIRMCAECDDQTGLLRAHSLANELLMQGGQILKPLAFERLAAYLEREERRLRLTGRYA